MEKHVCPPDHKHGANHTCYGSHKCRCDECRAAHTATTNYRRRMRAYGRYDNGLVDAQPVREHVQFLLDSGMKLTTLSGVSGVGITALRKLLYGRKDTGAPVMRVKREKSEALLAVSPDVMLLRASSLISSRGARRRIQALVARGWSLTRLAGTLGTHADHLRRIMQADAVTVAYHMRVADLYERLWDKQPARTCRAEQEAFTKALKYARVRRWVPPLAWDDIDNDPEPPVVEKDDLLDELAVELAMSGERVRLSRGERREAVRRLNEAKFSDAVIADRLHVAERTVVRIRGELGLQAVAMEDQLVNFRGVA